MEAVRGRPWLLDGLLAVVALLTELPGYLGGPAAVVAGEFVIAAAVALRRVLPFPAVIAFGIAFTVQAQVMSEPPEEQLCLLAVVLLGYTFGASYPWSRAVLGLALLAAGGCAHEALESRDYLFTIGICLVAWVPGRFVHQRQREVQLLEDRADRLERDREASVADAVTAERARLARELHDVVSHSVSAMTVSAAAAEQVLDRDREAARRTLVQLQQTGQSAVAELHRLLGLLRELPSSAAAAPAPGLDALDTLLQEARDAGQIVELDVQGEQGAVPESLGLSVYRIVQESLTNARKHSPGAAVQVTLAYSASCLLVTVANRPAPAGRLARGAAAGSWGTADGTAAPGGRGLLGLRERANLFGGRLDAGPAPDGGFAVRAELPLTGGARGARS